MHSKRMGIGSRNVGYQIQKYHQRLDHRKTSETDLSVDEFWAVIDP